MWVVEPDVDEHGDPNLAIVHVDSIFRIVHLLPIHQTNMFISRDITMHNLLDHFDEFYINRFADYHAFEVYPRDHMTCNCVVNISEYIVNVSWLTRSLELRFWHKRPYPSAQINETMDLDERLDFLYG